MSNKEKNNLDLWNSVCTTDAKQTQSANVDGNNLTAINGTYVVMQATKMWGVIGVGWGYEIVSERFDDTGPIRDKEGAILCEGKLHTILAKVWFMDGDKRSESVTHYGHTKYIYRSKWGFTTDYEYAKKSLTDALKKCLSMYGVCADVYLGKFDNPEYREQSQHKLDIENAENIEDEILSKKEELLEYIESSIKQFEHIPNQSALKLVLDKNVNNVKSICRAINIAPDKAITQLTEACKIRIEKIKEAKNEK